MEKHKCVDCYYCKVKYISSSSPWLPRVNVCTANDYERLIVDVNKEHFCEKWKEADNEITIY